jgi:hypothetical protein
MIFLMTQIQARIQAQALTQTARTQKKMDGFGGVADETKYPDPPKEHRHEVLPIYVAWNGTGGETWSYVVSVDSIMEESAPPPKPAAAEDPIPLNQIVRPPGASSSKRMVCSSSAGFGGGVLLAMMLSTTNDIRPCFASRAVPCHIDGQNLMPLLFGRIGILCFIRDAAETAHVLLCPDGLRQGLGLDSGLDLGHQSGKAY